MSFCLVMVVNRVPNYPTFFIQRFKNTKSKYVFVPKMGCPGLQGIKIFSIYMFLPCIYELLFSAGGL